VTSAREISTNGGSLPAGSSITYTITVCQTDRQARSATRPPHCVGLRRQVATDTDCVSLPNLWVTKPTTPAVRATGSTGSVSPARRSLHGLLRHSGSATVSGVSVTDPIPGNITGATWTARKRRRQRLCADRQRSIANTVTLPAGSYIKYVVTGTVSPRRPARSATRHRHATCRRCQERDRHGQSDHSGQPDDHKSTAPAVRASRRRSATSLPVSR